MSAQLLPPNASPLERALAEVIPSGLAPEIITTLWDANRCPAPMLPFLAWALAVDGWSSALTEAQQRALILSSVRLRRHRGTPWAIKQLFALLDIRATLTEWPVYQGEPYTFRIRIELSDRGLSQSTLAALRALVDAYKSARSVLDRLDIVLQLRSAANVAAACRARPRCNAYPRLAQARVTGQTATAAAMRLRPRLLVTPRKPI